MSIQTKFVTVQYADRFSPGVYGGREYSYIADHRLKVGDVVHVETRLGAGLARGARIDVNEDEIPQKVRPLLRHITGEALPPDKLPRPMEPQPVQTTMWGGGRK